MFRQSAIRLSSKGRTMIRDPRKTKKLHEQRQSAVVASKEEHQPQIHQQQSVSRPRMAFEPSTENQQSLGLGSYMLAGVGIGMGVTLVGAIFGGIG